MGERVHELGGDPPIGRGLLRRALEHPECVLLFDRAPAFPAEHCRRVDQHDAADDGVTGERDPREASGAQRRRHVGRVDRRRKRRFADARLHRVQHGLEQRFLAVEVVVQRTPAHARRSRTASIDVPSYPRSANSSSRRDEVRARVA